MKVCRLFIHFVWFGTAFLPRITAFPDLARHPVFKISKICGLSLLRVGPSGEFKPNMEEEKEEEVEEEEEEEKWSKGKRVETENGLWQFSSVAPVCAEHGSSRTGNNGNSGIKLFGMKMLQIDLSSTFGRWNDLQITFWSLFQQQSDAQQTPSNVQKCLDWLIKAASVH